MARVETLRISTGQQVKLIAWLRWRLFVNLLRAPGKRAELVARMVVAIVGAVITGALAFGLGAAGFAIMQKRPQSIGVLLWGIFLVGQFLPVIVSASAGSFDTRTLLRFPLRFPAFTALALSYCIFDPAALSTLVWLASAGIGAAIGRPQSAVWILGATALLGLTAILLNRLILLWLERILARRRSREILFLTVILSLVSVQFIGVGMQRYGEQIRPVVEAARPFLGVLPPGLSAAVMNASASGAWRDAAALLAALALWPALVFWFLRKRLLAQYRGEELSEARVAQDAKPQAQTAAAPELVSRIPFLSSQRAALLGKELRYLVRNPVNLVQLGIPFLLIMFFGLMLDQKGSEMGFFQRRPDAVLPSAMAYAIFIAMPMAHNSLSFESWGLQLLLLAPIRFRDALVAKNLALGLGVGGQALGVYALVQVLFGGQAAVIVAASFSALLFMLLLNFSVGNLLSVYFPRAFDFGSFRQRQSPWSVIVAMLTQIVGMGMVYLVYALALWRGNAWYAVLGYLLMSAGIFQVYLLVLERCDEIATERREILVAEICKG